MAWKGMESNRKYLGFIGLSFTSRLARRQSSTPRAALGAMQPASKARSKVRPTKRSSTAAPRGASARDVADHGELKWSRIFREQQAEELAAAEAERRQAELDAEAAKDDEVLMVP